MLVMDPGISGADPLTAGRVGEGTGVPVLVLEVAVGESADLVPCSPGVNPGQGRIFGVLRTEKRH